MELKLFFPVHQDSSDPHVARYPSQLLDDWMEARTGSMKSRISHLREGSVPEVEFIFVNIWLLKEAVPPGNVRYSKRHKQISVEVGINAIELELPVDEKDFEGIFQSAELALKYALGKYGMELCDEKIERRLRGY